MCASTSGTILIIDDDTNARDLARRALEPAGFKIVEATDGLHAISVLQDTTPDVILLDLMMPNMDGFEFHQHLQRQQHLQNIPTIVLSAKQLTPQELHALSTSERILKKAEQPYAQLSKLIEHIVHPA